MAHDRQLDCAHDLQPLGHGDNDGDCVGDTVTLGVVVAVDVDVTDALAEVVTVVVRVADGVTVVVVDGEDDGEICMDGLVVGVLLGLLLGNTTSNCGDSRVVMRPFPSRPSVPLPQHFVPFVIPLTAHVWDPPAVNATTPLITLLDGGELKD